MTEIFLKTASRFKQLSSLEAPTWRTALSSRESNTALIAWIAASQPAGWPAHSCSGLQHIISNNTYNCLREQPPKTSPTSIGRTPGCLPKAIRRLTMKTSRQAGLTNVVANLLATAERASQRVSEASQKEVHTRKKHQVQMDQQHHPYVE